MSKNLYEAPECFILESQIEGMLCQSGHIDEWEYGEDF